MTNETASAATFQYTKSRELYERAHDVIPGGIYGHFNPDMHKPDGTYPHYCERAEGARFWDADGNEFIDYMCAYGPMILGYRNRVVNEAYQAQIARADTCTLASPVMIELAEYMVEMIPVADWAYFGKNGADVTNLAVMVARAATGHKKIIAITDGYHGSTPWMQGDDRCGVVEGDHVNVVRIPWNDLAALDEALAEHDGDVAAFISSPYHHPAFQDNMLPAEGYWSGVHERLKRHGVLSICDDVRAGFRIDLRGSNEHFGYKPDLICYCKAIANGFPISALVGTDELKDAASTVFQTGSFWFSAGPMAAGLACLKELTRLDAANLITETGTKVFDGMVDIAKNHGHELKVTGVPSMPYLRALHEDGISFHRALCGECTRRGLFMTSHHNLFVSAAHTDEDVQKTWDIFEDALVALK
ncbi:MAG TPA: aminotransferase class III-fold pyridoxal phosphate-dependent enzyme [Candidatus Hydrogenedentes bacterium]|nr:aminotransferase class III-fold pyridoxal phosphate-dependent enzyme [Candidatus Hydrogenedentota bacterium]